MNLEKMKAFYEAEVERGEARAAAAEERYAGFDDGLLSFAAGRIGRRAAVAAVVVALGLAPLLVFYLFYSPEMFGTLVACLVLSAVVGHVLKKMVDEREDMLSEIARRAEAGRGPAMDGGVLGEPPASGPVGEAGAGADGLDDAEFAAVSSLRLDVAGEGGDVAAFVEDPVTGVYVPVESPDGVEVVRGAMSGAGCSDLSDERVGEIAGAVSHELLAIEEEDARGPGGDGAGF